MSVRNGRSQAKPGRADQPSKRDRTRAAIIETSIRLIAERGIEGTSVLEITKDLGISNGLFYYYFQDKEQLLETVGHAIVERLIVEIEDYEGNDAATQVARGPLIILNYVEHHPEHCEIMLRVIEDIERRHADLADMLRVDVAMGVEQGVFTLDDLDLAVAFCRSLVAVALRSRLEGNKSDKLGATTAVHTLTMLGIPPREAEAVVEQERIALALC